MANVYIHVPTEIQPNVFSYLMHSSAKRTGIQVARYQVQSQFSTLAFDTKSRETYHRPLRLFLDIDQLPKLTAETKIKFHIEITG